jgi:hypothetical protein
MISAKWFFKIFISVIFDILDFFMPPAIGTVYDAVGGFLGIILWGPLGAAQFGELIDITDRIDAFIPTLTIIGLISLFREED